MSSEKMHYPNQLVMKREIFLFMTLTKHIVRPPIPKDMWVNKLFVKHPQLYLPVLQSREESLAECEGLCSIFLDFEFPTSLRILDLCCGIGRHSIQLAKKGHQVTGIDISDFYLDYARRWANREHISDMVKFYRGDSRKIIDILNKHHEGNFDVVLSLFQSIGYYGSASDSNLLRSLTKLSSPCGLLIVELENRDWWMSNYARYSNYDFNHLKICEHWSLDKANSTAIANTKFYNRVSKNKMRLQLDVECSMKLYSLSEFILKASKCGWAYRKVFETLKDTKPFNITSKQFVVVFQRD